MKRYISLAVALMLAVSVAFVSVASAAEHKTEKKVECKKGMGIDAHGKCVECKKGEGIDAHGKCVECKDGHDAHGAKCEETHMEKHEEKKAH